MSLSTSAAWSSHIPKLDYPPKTFAPNNFCPLYPVAVMHSQDLLDIPLIRTCKLLIVMHHPSPIVSNKWTHTRWQNNLMRFQRKRMPLIWFPRCTVTWVWVQYCMAVFAWAEHFNKTGIWSKVKAGGAVLAARKAEKQLFITSDRSAAVPRQYYNQPRLPAHLWLKKTKKNM